MDRRSKRLICVIVSLVVGPGRQREEPGPLNRPMIPPVQVRTILRVKHPG